MVLSGGEGPGAYFFGSLNDMHCSCVLCHPSLDLLLYPFCFLQHSLNDNNGNL